MMPLSLYSLRLGILKIGLCLFPLLSKPCQAQNGVTGYSVTRYTDENGLPQNSVSSITCDSNGFLWLATEDGLVRFDGQSFFIFSKTILNTSDNRFRHFLPPVGNPGMAEPLFYTHNTFNKSYVGIYANSNAKAVQGYPDTDIRKKVRNKVKRG